METVWQQRSDLVRCAALTYLRDGTPEGKSTLGH